MAPAGHPSPRSAGGPRKKRASVVLCGVSGDFMTGGNLWLISPEDVSYPASVNPEARPDTANCDRSKRVKETATQNWVGYSQIAFFFEGGWGDVWGCLWETGVAKSHKKIRGPFQ